MDEDDYDKLRLEKVKAVRSQIFHFFIQLYTRLSCCRPSAADDYVGHHTIIPRAARPAYTFLGTFESE